MSAVITLTGGLSSDTNQAPVLTGLTVSTSSVDVSSGAQVIKFTPTATDADGIRWESSQVALRGPQDEYRYIKFSATGDHSAYLTLKPTDVNGNWSIERVYL